MNLILLPNQNKWSVVSIHLDVYINLWRNMLLSWLVEIKDNDPYSNCMHVVKKQLFKKFSYILAQIRYFLKILECTFDSSWNPNVLKG